MARRHRVGAGLLPVLFALGVVLVGVGILADYPSVLTAGAWLVSLAIVVRLLLSHGPR